MRQNDEVNKVIEIGFTIADNSQFNTHDGGILQHFFETCSSAFNTTRNLDAALKLLRKVEQMPEATFSETLFANVLE